MNSRIVCTILMFIFISVIKVNAQNRYTGKVVKAKGTCTWLIRITEADDVALINKLVEPTGEFPIQFQRKRLKLKFDMNLLRQPVPDGCKANFVGSIINPTKAK
jgi:hypothetical protein